MHSKAVRIKATGGSHFEYSEVRILQYNDQNLALANMAKSANDNMMTTHQLRGCSGTPRSPPWVLLWPGGTEVSVGKGTKPPLGIWTRTKSPEA